MTDTIHTQTGYAPVEHGELYYETTGSGPAILLLHAGVADHTMWEPQLAPFSQSHQVITYDLRGYGLSRTESASFSNAQDMHDLLTHLGVQTAVIIGNSRGGRIAIDFALQYPQMTTAIVWICGGLGGMEDAGTQQETDWFNKLEAYWESKDWATLSDLEAHTWANGIGQPEDRAPAHVREKLRQMIYSNYTREDGEGQPRPLDPPAIGRLSEITCPVLLLIGDLDTSGTVKSGEILSANLPNAETVHFPTIAHMVSMEVPDQFNSLVLDFLARRKEIMNELQFSIEINATKERVWDTLWQDETFREWASIIDPETYMVGDLKEGNEIQFISAESGYGVTSLVEKLVAGEYLLLRHRADTQEAGSREREKEWTGGGESYSLAEKDGTTTLTTALNVPPELEDYFKVAYPKALERVKELAERKK